MIPLSRVKLENVWVFYLVAENSSCQVYTLSFVWLCCISFIYTLLFVCVCLGGRVAIYTGALLLNTLHPKLDTPACLHELYLAAVAWLWIEQNNAGRLLNNRKSALAFSLAPGLNSLQWDVCSHSLAIVPAPSWNCNVANIYIPLLVI